MTLKSDLEHGISGLDFALQLACEVGHPVLVLLVLVVLEKNLLDPALGLLEGLLILCGLGLQVAQLLLEQIIKFTANLCGPIKSFKLRFETFKLANLPLPTL